MLHIIAFGIIILGLIGILLGIVGMIRFPDLYTKIHAASVIESASIPLILFALSLLQNNITNSLKIIFMIFLIFLLNPVSSNMLAGASIKLDKSKRLNYKNADIKYT